MNKVALKKELRKVKLLETKFLLKKKNQNKSIIEDKIAKYVPAGLSNTLNVAFEKAFEMVFRNGTGVIKKTYDEKKLKEAYDEDMKFARAADNHMSIKSFQRKSQRLRVADMALTTAEGAGLGLLGIGVPDIPVFTAVLLRNIYQTSLCYGFDYDNKTEQMLVLKLIEAAMSKGEETEKLNEEVDSFMHSIDNEDYTYYGLLTEQIGKTAKSISDDILYMKFIQTIPVVGIVGGMSNSVCMHKVNKYVDIKYRKRFLLKQESNL